MGTLTILLAIFESCVQNSPNVIYYKYNGVVISRFDFECTSYFLYGQHNNLDTSDTKLNYIKDESLVYDDWMSMWMVFKNDSAVELGYITSSISSNGHNPKFTISRNSNLNGGELYKNLIDSGYVVKRIAKPIEIEEGWAKDDNCKVEVKYLQ